MEARLKPQENILRSDWDDLIRRSPQGNFYALTYYMDIVAPEWMGIEVVDEKSELLAVMPIQIHKKYGMRYALQPRFTQYWGIFFDKRDFPDAYRENSWKRKVVMAVVEQIPETIKLFGFAMAPEFDYAFPFHWKGYDLKTRYSYWLDLTKGEESVWRGIKRKKRFLLNKTEKDLAPVVQAKTSEGLISLIEENLEAGNPIMSREHLSLLPKVITELGDDALILEARDQNGTLLSVSYTVGFGRKMVYLIGAQKPNIKDSGGPALLLWEAIKRSIGHYDIFDFEGSMLEGVESFFRTFGGRPKPYLFIEKNELPLLVQWIRKLR